MKLIPSLILASVASMQAAVYSHNMNKFISPLILVSASSLQAALYNYNMSTDNDMTLYTDSIAGLSLTEHFNQTADWEVANVGSFNTNDDYIYLIGMNFTNVGSFAGFINNIDLSTVPWEISSDVSGSLTGYTGTLTSFNPLIAEVSALIGTETFAPAALTGDTVTGVGIAGVADAIDIPGNNSAYLFRTAASNVVPEPSTSLLGLGAAALALLRRRRMAA
ncbi:PEP-CTERM sorting domain-containing protein [Akkermansiaceae bacterium]|nr:PEP-CTERM sorting domain-containing protein [Akkermansiaceae bacterium]